jgi:hypothetical protein
MAENSGTKTFNHEFFLSTTHNSNVQSKLITCMLLTHTAKSRIVIALTEIKQQFGYTVEATECDHFGTRRK